VRYSTTRYQGRLLYLYSNCIFAFPAAGVIIPTSQLSSNLEVFIDRKHAGGSRHTSLRFPDSNGMRIPSRTHAKTWGRLLEPDRDSPRPTKSAGRNKYSTSQVMHLAGYWEQSVMVTEQYLAIISWEIRLHFCWSHWSSTLNLFNITLLWKTVDVQQLSVRDPQPHN